MRRARAAGGAKAATGGAMGRFLDRFVGNISPSAILVSTLFWSWMDLVTFSPLLEALAGGAYPPQGLAASLAVAALALACLAASKGLGRAALKPLCYAALALALGTGGTLLLYAGAAFGDARLTAAGWLLTGLFQAAGIAVAGDVAMCQGKTNALIHMAACLPLNIVFVLLGMFLQPGASVFLCAALPLLSALSYKVFLVRGDNEAVLLGVLGSGPGRRRGAGGGDAPGAPARAWCLVLLVLVTVAFGLVNARIQFLGLTVGLGGLPEFCSLFVRAVVAAWVFLAYVLRSRQPFSFLLVAICLMAAGLFALSLGLGAGEGARLAASTVFYAGYAMFDLLIWAILVIMHRGSRLALMRFACGAYAVDELGNALGTWAGALLPLGEAALSAALGAMGAGMLVAAFIVLNMPGVPLQSLRASVDMMEAGGPAGAEPEGACGGAGGTGADGRRDGVGPATKSPGAEALAARYFLTGREEDVLELLLAGRSVPSVSERLCVSQNTVKTHVRHIYAKLDVHNREELLDLCGEEAGR